MIPADLVFTYEKFEYLMLQVSKKEQKEDQRMNSRDVLYSCLPSTFEPGLLYSSYSVNQKAGK